MRNFILYIIAIFASTLLHAQKNNPGEGISLSIYIPNQAERIPGSAKRMLSNRLRQIITKNGIGQSPTNSRFVLVPVVDVLSKDVTATAPVKVALNLSVTLYIGDGVTGVSYASESFDLKGVGTNETKSYISAIKRLSPKNKMVLAFLDEGKNKIIEYYNSNCATIMQKVKSLKAQNKFEEALYIATSVPIQTDCFKKMDVQIKALYQEIIDNECRDKLAKAKSIWVASQDIDGANRVGAVLADVEPQSSCYKEVKVFFNKIEKRVKDLQHRDWKYKLKVLDLSKTYIKAARDVGVAYGKNQPKNVTYNVSGWHRR